MFTGIIESLGTVSALEQQDDSTTLTISDAESILEDAHQGDSISINGTCLTITWFNSTDFKVGVSPETLRRTNLGSLAVSSKVNLERAVLASSTRMGGHFVQGHVDTIATILSVQPDGDALTFRLKPRDPAVLRYVVEKGYITLDGASLTVTNVVDVDSDDDDHGHGQGWWEVMLIAYTQARVVTASKKVGDHVNVEVDMLGKYVDKSIRAYFEEQQQQQQQHQQESGKVPYLEKFVQRIVDERLKTSGR